MRILADITPASRVRDRLHAVTTAADYFIVAETDSVWNDRRPREDETVRIVEIKSTSLSN